MIVVRAPLSWGEPCRAHLTIFWRWPSSSMRVRFVWHGTCCRYSQDPAELDGKDCLGVARRGLNQHTEGHLGWHFRRRKELFRSIESDGGWIQQMTPKREREKILINRLFIQLPFHWCPWLESSGVNDPWWGSPASRLTKKNKKKGDLLPVTYLSISTLSSSRGEKCKRGRNI